MSRLLIVVENAKDWRAYYPSEELVTFEDYLKLDEAEPGARTRVINLCRSYRHLSNGYYCSLLAEARGHRVLPSVKTLNDLRSRSLYGLELEHLNRSLERLIGAQQGGENYQLPVRFYFGSSPYESMSDLGRQLFEVFPAPILEVHFKFKGTWLVQSVKTVGFNTLTEEEENLFASALEQFDKKVWMQPKSRRRFRYGLAMLVNPEEKFPPSDGGALRRFVRAGRRLGLDVEMIGRKDFGRLAEYDALFIRETTSLTDHTFRFAKKAESEGLVVIDDPISIMRCTNKIYLADLLRTNRVAAPTTRLLSRDAKNQAQAVIEELGLPVVLKIPDGSFSRGVLKAESADELNASLKALFKQSALLLAQEYVYTEYDWRIGVLNHKPIYACRYYMAKDHWQIYHHSGQESVAGGFDTLPTYEAPRKVVDLALRAVRCIGDGLYGVDIKLKAGKPVIIEVNDNPSIDSGVEDKFLGDRLYELIMEEFRRRLGNR